MTSPHQDSVREFKSSVTAAIDGLKGSNNSSSDFLALKTETLLDEFGSVADLRAKEADSSGTLGAIAATAQLDGALLLMRRRLTEITQLSKEVTEVAGALLKAPSLQSTLTSITLKTNETYFQPFQGTDVNVKVYLYHRGTGDSLEDYSVRDHWGYSPGRAGKEEWHSNNDPHKYWVTREVCSGKDVFALVSLGAIIISERDEIEVTTLGKEAFEQVAR